MKTAGTSGLLLLNKPPGLTSFESLKQVKAEFSTPQVGHTGTLDKFASGLLLVLAGRAVKLTPWFSGCDKSYEGTVRFGEETDTLDPEGRVVASAPPPGREAVETALASFRGDILQRPPAYSALHLGGRRAHELARSGALPEMPERPVTIHDLELLSWEPPLASIRVRCSKGTYIRSLARDIALAAGSRAHLASLTRTRVAGFRLEEAVPPGSPLQTGLLPLGPGVFSRLGIPALETDGAGETWLAEGRPISRLFDSGAFRPLPGTAASRLAPGEESGGAAFAVFNGAGELLAIIESSRKTSPEGTVLPGLFWKYGHVHARRTGC